MIKILRNDNQRLQDKIEEIEKNQELEKKSKDKKQILIERELQEHKVCKQKIENYQEKLRKLAERNKSLMDKIIYGKTKGTSNTFINNNISSEDEGSFQGKFYKIKENIGSGTNKSLKKGNLFTLRKLGVNKSQSNSLPRINISNNPLSNSYKNNNINNNIINIKIYLMMKKCFN